jgi:hypothetical protein
LRRGGDREGEDGGGEQAEEEGHLGDLVSFVIGGVLWRIGTVAVWLKG